MVWLNGLMLEENFVHIIFLAGNFEVILKSLEWLQYEFRLHIVCQFDRIFSTNMLFYKSKITI